MDSRSDLGVQDIRANDILHTTCATQAVTPNTFPCWLAMASETPHRMTLYLKLGAPPSLPQDYDVQAEVFKEKWAVLKEMPFPWSIVLAPGRLMMLSSVS